ncbi:MAG: thiamine phosphate synthase [Acidobacteria bacterium Pan2503]|uniref:Thiamine-phosphate synthase n=1 Tax=Candidatus Acidiferrum panamense TaxID=2741543 RepID=A0A7V8NW71_9BACT|nr:thiamine phosphate synthase [Candidatus Acidoferrum panamensis]
MRLVLPRLYVILDAALLATTPQRECARQLVDAGVRLLQYRNKAASARSLLENAKGLAEELIPRAVTFIVNDRSDVAALAGASGVHVGQEDLSVEEARAVVGRDRLVGISTHNRAQFEQAAATSADYIAVGPVFSTSTKANADPVVGTELIREVRPLTDKPIVAIGGITLERAADLVRAGAQSVAVTSDILRAPDPAERARQFIKILQEANHAAGA